MPRAVTTRHDHLVKLLAMLFRRAGALVHIEPRVVNQNRLRPDLEITLSDHTLLVDVAVVHPASPGRKQTGKLAAARKRQSC